MGLRYAAASALILIGSLGASPAPGRPKPGDALLLARMYVAGWEETLTNLVAEEHYTQEVREYRSTHPSGPRGYSPRIQKRQLRSEVVLLRAPAENLWLSFRDVFEVDGRAVHDRQQRFDALFSGPAAMMLSTAERIAEEGARYNLGRNKRTINTPTAALVFLHPTYEANTRWELDPDERLDGRRTWELRFEQRKPPYSVRIPDRVVPLSQGSFWLDPSNGAILRWDLRVRGGPSLFRVKVSYGWVRTVEEGLVPLRMEEDYDSPPFERFFGVATYSNHRLFRTAGRIIGS